jgi:hypothetical protein
MGKSVSQNYPNGVRRQLANGAILAPKVLRRRRLNPGRTMDMCTDQELFKFSNVVREHPSESGQYRRA